MDKYDVMSYPRAFRDIDDIYAYIAYEKLSTKNAKGQIDRIWEAIKYLDKFPESHQERLVGCFYTKRLIYSIFTGSRYEYNNLLLVAEYYGIFI